MAGELDLSGNDLTTAKSELGILSRLHGHRPGYAPMTLQRQFVLVNVKVLAGPEEKGVLSYIRPRVTVVEGINELGHIISGARPLKKNPFVKFCSEVHGYCSPLRARPRSRSWKRVSRIFKTLECVFPRRSI
jgi:hypothetical protein